MAKDIRSLSRYNESTEQTEIFYPATTTDAIAHPTKQKSLTDVIADIETNAAAYDISASHSGTTYADLAAALGTNGANVPSTVRKGGMSIKFVQSSDSNYVQFRYMGTSIADANFADVANWQGVDAEPKFGSKNLVEGGGVYESNRNIVESVFSKGESFNNATKLLDGAAIDKNGTIVSASNYVVAGGKQVHKGDVVLIHVPESNRALRFALFNGIDNIAVDDVAANVFMYQYPTSITDFAILIPSDGYLCFSCYVSVRTSVNHYYGIYKNGLIAKDNTPTNGSDKPVESGGVYLKLQEIIVKEAEDIAERKAIDDEQQKAIDESVYIGVSPNIVNPKTITSNAILRNDGTTDNSDNNCVTDYIPVDEKNIKTDGNGASTSTYPNMCVYNQNKEFIRYIQAAGTYTYQEGDYYIRLSRRMANIQDGNYIFACYGDTLLDSHPYGNMYVDAVSMKNMVDAHDEKLKEMPYASSIYEKGNSFSNNTNIIVGAKIDQSGKIISSTNQVVFGGTYIHKGDVVYVSKESAASRHISIALFNTAAVIVGSQAVAMLNYESTIPEDFEFWFVSDYDAYLICSTYTSVRTSINFNYGRIKNTFGVDNALSTTSENPVQNKVIAKEVTLIEDNTNILPEKYESYLNDKLNQIYDIKIGAGLQSDDFLFFTDSHFYPTVGGYFNREKIIGRLIQRSIIDKVVFGGDLVYAGVNAEKTRNSAIYLQKLARRWIRPFGVLYQVQGNHDIVSNASGGTINYPQNVVKDFMMGEYADMVHANPSDPASTYYYFDNKDKKIRYIVFEGTYNHVNSVPDAQAKWLVENAVMTLESGWRIVAFCHYNVGGTVLAGTGYQDTHGNVTSILSAINNKSSITIDGSTYNMSTLSNVKVLYLQTGHHHCDCQTWFNGVLQVTTSSDCALTDNTVSMYADHWIPRGYTAWNEYVSRNPGAVIGTNEHVIDYVHVDATNDVVKMLRIGAYCDRTFHTNDIQIPNGGSVTLTPTLTGILSWHFYNSDGPAHSSDVVNDDGTYTSIWTGLDESSYISVNNGVVTALQSGGDCVVMCMDENQNKEHWHIMTT